MGNNGGGAALSWVAGGSARRFSMRKMIHIATASRDALERLAADNGKSFQDLMDEAIADLLKKHSREAAISKGGQRVRAHGPSFETHRSAMLPQDEVCGGRCGGVVQSIWQSGVLDPQGPIGAAERLILLNATVIMLAIIVPVIVLVLGCAWWFRAGNARARYLPNFEYSGPIELVVWAIPALVIMFLGGMAWISSHDLDPPKPIASKVAPIEIQVVALDWKWLFIYPAEGVASLNQLVVPAGTPLSFRITSATVMNSFFVPQLGSQIYAMAGMVNRLELLADKPGSFQGLSAQYSGGGFSDMRFEGGGTLDPVAYGRLARPSAADKPATFGTVSPRLFEAAIQQAVK